MIKKILTPFSLLLLILISSCQERYPDLEDGLYAEFVTTKGTMVAELYYDKVPVTVANFVALAEGNHPMVEEQYKDKPFFNGITFHRVMDQFMIQGGDPTASGSGTPGYRFAADFDADLKHDKPGVLSMANSGALNTNGSQFFITEVPYPSLNAFDEQGIMKPCGQPRVSCHSVFGQLVKGVEVQDSISNVKVGVGNKPIEDVTITELNIIRKGSDAKAFNAPKVFEEEMPKVEDNIRKNKEEAQQALKTKAEEASKAWLKSNEELEGQKIESPTGMSMVITKDGDGPKPNSSQRVNINCAGYFEDGTLFYTTWKEVAENNGKYDERTDQGGGYEPFSMPYNETAGLVAGFREAMLNMKIGDKARVFIPYYLGYGESGRPPVIPPNTNLVFEVELVSIAGQQ
ncbi:peptidylprolyl isomerase [Winogradskyella sp. A3E31]|uniref:peptidylprolyl isomerase n=1 Tax=Winogradskyella sp. A3E31 TaxID=3349637 RepID=UPI00398B1EC1